MVMVMVMVMIMVRVRVRVRARHVCPNLHGDGPRCYVASA